MLKLEDVVSGCIKNENKSKEMMYKSFYGYLMAVTLRYTPSIEEAEELVNDSFIKIFKNLPQFNVTAAGADVVKPFKAWIGKIAARTAIDSLRSKRNFVSIDDVEAAEPITAVNVISELNVKDILKLLNEIPEMHRFVFNLYEIDGYSHQEISTLLNISESASRVYLTRAKQALRKLYANTLNTNYETI